jgi:hypothetical protein
MLAGAGAGLALAGLGVEQRLHAPAAGAAVNPIVLENQKPGTTAWALAKRSNDTAQQVRAYARQASVAAGEQVQVAVQVDRSQSVSARVFRLGWYGGTGGRLVQDLGSTTVARQPAPQVNATTGEIICPWATAFQFTVPADWLSGIYVVRLVNADGFDTWAMFAVRDGRSGAFLYQQPITTYAAYDCFPDDRVTGKSLYGTVSYGAPTIAGGPQAVHVNLDRPYQDSGAGTFFAYEADLVRFLEREGYDVTYATVVDTHAGTVSLRNRPGVISAGHDEYWSQQVYDAFVDARDRGVNLFFASANTAYWRVRFEPSADGRPHRRIVGWKEAASLDPGTPKTNLFRASGYPEQTLVGVQYVKWASRNAPFVPKATNHWVWQGTGASDGVTLPVNIVGYEVDTRYPNVPLPSNTEYTILGASPFTGEDGNTVTANASIYRAPSGAWVFATGTISWGWGLGRSGYTHAAVQQATRNVLNRFALGAPPTTTTTTTTTVPPVVPPPPPPPTPQTGTGPFAPFASPDAFVAQQYRDLLGREADGQGLAYWVGRLAADGSNRSEIVAAFLGAAEFAPWYQLGRLYQAVFARIPDPGGYQYWFDRYNRRELGLLEIAAYFVESPEWINRFGLFVDDDRLVDLVYGNLFGRAPDPEGRAYWVGELRRGLSRPALVVGFSESREFIVRYQGRLDGIATHQGLLRRPPTADELAAVALSLDSGARSLAQEIERLLATEEYRRRFA